MQHADLEPLVRMTPQQIFALFVTAFLKEQRAFTQMVSLLGEQIHKCLASSTSIEQWVDLQQDVQATLAQMLQAQHLFSQQLQHVQQVNEIRDMETCHDLLLELQQVLQVAGQAYLQLTQAEERIEQAVTADEFAQVHPHVQHVLELVTDHQAMRSRFIEWSNQNIRPDASTTT
jgi:hypothetical protein